MKVIELKRKRILKQYLSQDQWLTLIQADPSELENAPHQTLEMCFAAVTKNPNALIHVESEFRNDARMMIAVLENPSHVFDIYSSNNRNNLPVEIVIASVRKDPQRILSIALDQNVEFDIDVYAAALELDGELIDYIEPPYRDQLIDLALRTTPSAVENLSLPEKTQQRCLEVVRRNGMLLEHVVQSSADICAEAIKQNPMAIEFVELAWQTPGMFLTALRKASGNGQLQSFINCFFVQSKWSLPLKMQLLGLVNTVLALNPLAYSDHLVQEIIEHSLKLR